MSILLYTGHYSIQLCRRHPEKLFVFGDNAQRVGNGGQAIIRPEPNVFGVATKVAPGGSERDFFEEGNPEHMGILAHDLRNLETTLALGKIVVWPVFKYGSSTLGCGLAELPMRAPSLYQLINTWQRRAVRLYKGK